MTPPPHQGFRCDRCGYTVTGLFAERKFRTHLEVHAERERLARQANQVTADDVVFLRVQKIKWP